MTYFSVLKKRGYKPLVIGRKLSVYSKNHRLNVATIVVLKDSHCKGQDISFEVRQLIKDNGNNQSNLDNAYLLNEVNFILNEFNRLKERKQA